MYIALAARQCGPIYQFEWIMLILSPDAQLLFPPYPLYS